MSGQINDIMLDLNETMDTLSGRIDDLTSVIESLADQLGDGGRRGGGGAGGGGGSGGGGGRSAGASAGGEKSAGQIAAQLAGQAAGAAQKVGGIIGPTNQIGASLSVGGSLVSGALSGAAAGAALGPVGAGVGAAAGAALSAASTLANVQGAQAELAEREARNADPSVDAVSAGFERRRIAAARGDDRGLVDRATDSIASFISGRTVDPNVEITRDQVEAAPEARAAARLQEELAVLGRQGFDFDGNHDAAFGRFRGLFDSFAEQERGAERGREFANAVVRAANRDRSGNAGD